MVGRSGDDARGVAGAGGKPLVVREVEFLCRRRGLLGGDGRGEIKAGDVSLLTQDTSDSWEQHSLPGTRQAGQEVIPQRSNGQVDTCLDLG